MHLSSGGRESQMMHIINLRHLKPCSLAAKIKSHSSGSYKAINLFYNIYLCLRNMAILLNCCCLTRCALCASLVCSCSFKTGLLVVVDSNGCFIHISRYVIRVRQQGDVNSLTAGDIEGEIPGIGHHRGIAVTIV